MSRNTRSRNQRGLERKWNGSKPRENSDWLFPFGARIHTCLLDNMFRVRTVGDVGKNVKVSYVHFSQGPGGYENHHMFETILEASNVDWARREKQKVKLTEHDLMVKMERSHPYHKEIFVPFKFVSVLFDIVFDSKMVYSYLIQVFQNWATFSKTMTRWMEEMPGVDKNRRFKVLLTWINLILLRKSFHKLYYASS